MHSELFFHPIGLLSLTGIRGKPYNGARRAKAAQCAATIRRPRWDSQGGAASGRDRRGNGGSAPLLARESGRLVYDRSNLCEACGVGMSTTSQPGRGIRGAEWKSTSIIAEANFHSGGVFPTILILFLTLQARVGYDSSYSFGSNPIETRKLRQPTPRTGQVGREPRPKRRGAGRLSMHRKAPMGPTGRSCVHDERGARAVIHLTPFLVTLLYLVTARQT